MDCVLSFQPHVAGQRVFLNCCWTCLLKYEYTIFIEVYALKLNWNPRWGGGTVGLAPTSAHAHCNVQLNSDWALWPRPHRMLLDLCFIYVNASHCLEELGGCINVRVVLDKVPTKISEGVCVCLNKQRWRKPLDWNILTLHLDLEKTVTIWTVKINSLKGRIYLNTVDSTLRREQGLVMHNLCLF